MPIENKPQTTPAQLVDIESGHNGASSKQQIRQMSEVKPLNALELDALKIVYPGMHDAEVLNRFRDLRTKLMQKAGKSNFSVMVSAVNQGGGSSHVSINLAAAIALDIGKTALLIDCNLSRPTIENLLSTPPEYGLTNYLEDPDLNIDDIIYSSGIPRLRVTPTGSNQLSGSELFTSNRMANFINKVTNRYDDRYVVLDAPPMTSAPDARVLADLCDFIVLVVPYGGVTEPQIRAAMGAVNPNKLAGVVFNN